ncbi:unnamed protein product [Bursaphelenchus xylophilus]|uniref:(pine wood nematode) hypothetical protein n=1 Tax=Bursaphelenchus xylophilus TaxID=6326 RepID=A0A1I7S760_BURXY|nr:unnamed protein product [Bursaphelenchus xylophilus]CAG9084648.1 unnamed protein product [Bursaphelenchus xylophilus]
MSYELRSLSNDEEINYDLSEETVETAYGPIRVVIYGDKTKKPIISFHDIGLDANGNFQNFFQFGTATELNDSFCVFNINAPGQEADAKPFPLEYEFPSMEGLVDVIDSVVRHFNIKYFIGFGVGAGANVLLRYTLKNQSKVEALVLINAVISRAGWIEWGYEKLNIKSLRSTGMNNFVVEYLLWHYLGKRFDEVNPEVISQYRTMIYTHPNPGNLAMYMEAYLNRTEIIVQQPANGSVSSPNHPILKVPVLQLVGSRSAFIEETVDLHSKLDPARSEWIKISDCSGLVLDDKPEKVTESLLLFLQGLGYFTQLNVRKVVDKLSESYEYGRSNVCGIEAVNEHNHSAF